MLLEFISKTFERSRSDLKESFEASWILES